MKHCIVGLHFESYYITVLCHYQGSQNIYEPLKQFHSSRDAAEDIVASGDISQFLGASPCHYSNSFGYNWNQVKPIVHETPQALVQYCMAVEATHLICFESGKWEEISLVANENVPDFANNSEYAA